MWRHAHNWGAGWGGHRMICRGLGCWAVFRRPVECSVVGMFRRRLVCCAVFRRLREARSRGICVVRAQGSLCVYLFVLRARGARSFLFAFVFGRRGPSVSDQHARRKEASFPTGSVLCWKRFGKRGTKCFQFLNTSCTCRSFISARDCDSGSGVFSQ